MPKKMNLFKIISVVFVIVTFIVGVYLFMNPGETDLVIYSQLSSGLMILFLSFSEFKEKRRWLGLFILVASLINLFVFMVVKF